MAVGEEKGKDYKDLKKYIDQLDNGGWRDWLGRESIENESQTPNKWIHLSALIAWGMGRYLLHLGHVQSDILLEPLVKCMKYVCAQESKNHRFKTVYLRVIRIQVLMEGEWII